MKKSKVIKRENDDSQPFPHSHHVYNKEFLRTPSDNSHTHTLEEVLDDLCSRFILNIPSEELVSSDRVCFQAELAYWFYDDFFRVSDPTLPYFTLKGFCLALFSHCPSLFHYREHGEQIVSDFIKYKIQVPVCGAILLNPSKTKCLMVKGWNAKTAWSFPKGKINEEETWTDCAIREVSEEIGFDVRSQLISTDFIQFQWKGQSTRLYIIQNIPEHTPFAPQTRKEISDIAWHPISSLEKIDNLQEWNRRYFTAKKALSLLRRWLNSNHSVGNITDERKDGVDVDTDHHRQPIETRLISSEDGQYNLNLTKLSPLKGNDDKARLLKLLLTKSDVGDSEVAGGSTKKDPLIRSDSKENLLTPLVDPTLSRSTSKWTNKDTQLSLMSLLKPDPMKQDLHQSPSNHTHHQQENMKNAPLGTLVTSSKMQLQSNSATATKLPIPKVALKSKETRPSLPVADIHTQFSGRDYPSPALTAKELVGKFMESFRILNAQHGSGSVIEETPKNSQDDSSYHLL